MLKVLQFGPDTRAVVLDLGEGAHVSLASGGRKLSMLIPAPVVNTLAVELDACRRGAERAGRPAPPRYKWPQLVARLNRNALTAADLAALRDLLFHLGISA